jgi:hypothetical protein
MEYELNKIDKEELKKLNLVDKDGNLLLDKENLEFLRNGKQTDDIELKGIKIKGKEVDIKASLSLYKERDRVRLRIHPYYKDLEKNQLLSEQERTYFSRNKGVHSKFTAISGEIQEHGKAKYKFDDKQQDSYYVKLKTDSGKSETVWGINLAKAVQGKNIGEKVTIKYTGKERVNVNIPQTHPDGKVTYKTIETDRNNFSVIPYNEKNDYRNNRVLIEFDKEKNSFQIVNSNQVPKVKAINGEKLTKEQEEALERGEEIKTKGGNVSYSPQKQSLITNSKALMIASILFDGGISYAIIRTTDYFINKQQQKDLLKNEERENQQEQQPRENQEQTKENGIKPGIDKEYIKQLETIRNEIDNKIRQSDDSAKKEFTEIKNYVNKEIEAVSVSPYQESDLEKCPEHEAKVGDTESIEQETIEESREERIGEEEQEHDVEEEKELKEGLGEEIEEEEEEEKQEQSRGRRM